LLFKEYLVVVDHRSFGIFKSFRFLFIVQPDDVCKCFTAVLFMLGKFAIGAYLGSSAIASVYGTAGSVILILGWVYYSAIILYFGAEFTKVYAHTHGQKIIPNEYSVRIQRQKHELEIV